MIRSSKVGFARRAIGTRRTDTKRSTAPVCLRKPQTNNVQRVTIFINISRVGIKSVPTRSPQSCQFGLGDCGDAIRFVCRSTYYLVLLGTYVL